MKLAIAKLRLLGVLSLAGFVIALIFSFPKLANFLIIVSLLSFAVIIFLYIREFIKSGVIKSYFSAKEQEEIESE